MSIESGYLLDSHTHTLASGHAYNTIMEMATAAAGKGLKLLAITEHGEKIPGSCDNIYFMNLKVVPRTLAGIEVLFGAEANIMDYDGNLDIPDHILKNLDIVVASMHGPCIDPGTREENTRSLLRTMENPNVTIIGHPDDGRYPLDYEQVVKAAKARHVLLELNNHSLDPACYRENTEENDTIMLELCKQYEVPIIMDSDAHWIDDIGSTRFSMPLIRKLNFPRELIVNFDLELYKTYRNPMKFPRSK